MTRCPVCLFVALALVGAWATSAVAAGPEIRRFTPPGLTTGATTSLVIVGVELVPESRLLLSVPIAKQEVKSIKGNQVQIDVTLAADVTPGIHQMWVATSTGVSSPVAIAVDHLPEVAFADEAAKLPVAMYGTLGGAAIIRTTFTGQARQPIVVEVEARRLGSNFNPVLHLYDSRNVQVAWAQQSAAIGGDARLVAELPADGKYTVELHDAPFRAGGPFRLKLGALHYADLAFPLGVRVGESSPLGFVSSNFPAGTAVVAHGTTVGEMPAPWPGLAGLTGARPRVVVSELDEVLESSVGDAMQQVNAPVAINGRLAVDGEEDRYQINVAPGAKLRFDVLASRVGSPLDGVLSIAKAGGGGALATSDDRAGTSDPGVDVTVPADSKALVVSIRDLNKRGGADYIYRLSVTPIGQPDFSLAVLGSDVELPRSGVAVVRVRATRAGYNGPIKLSVAGAPSGVKLAGDEIPAGATDTLLSLAAGDVPPGAVVASIVGDSVDPKIKLRRPAVLADRPASRLQPWLGQELAVAVTEPPPVTVKWDTISADAKLPLGSGLLGKATLVRSKGADGPVQLSLLTSQVMPQRKVAAVAAKPGKQAQPEKMEDDVERTLRLDGDGKIKAGASEAAVKVLVPGDLPDIPYDVALKAELLSADGKTVLASSVTPVSRLRTIYPFAVELAGAAAVEAKAGTGETGKLAGKVSRTAGFDYPIDVTFAGLAAELPLPTVTVPKGQTDFTLPVSFPFNAPKGVLKGAKLVGLARVDAATVVRSAETPVAVTVVPGGPPPALYRVFEDEPVVGTYLNEGPGKAQVDAAERYSGTSALKLTGEQASRKRLPGLGIKIAEKPGDGEYRYLRFAWKAKGGNNILLQLFGTGGTGPKDVKQQPVYAYEAGDGGNRLRLAATRQSRTLPAEWTVVTRDLFADFGAMTVDGIGLNFTGPEGYLDHVYLAKSEKDFEGCPAPAAKPETPKAPAK